MRRQIRANSGDTRVRNDASTLRRRAKAARKPRRTNHDETVASIQPQKALQTSNPWRKPGLGRRGDEKCAQKAPNAVAGSIESGDADNRGPMRFASCGETTNERSGASRDHIGG
jgi:hypothetical protein